MEPFFIIPYNMYIIPYIMHKWANPHFDDFEKKSRSNMKYKIKRINTNYHKKVTKSVTKWSNPQCETRILIKLLLSMTYIFIVFFNVG